MISNKQQRYIGDGVYAMIANGQLLLNTSDGESEENQIIFDAKTLESLFLYLEVDAMPKNNKPAFNIGDIVIFYNREIEPKIVTGIIEGLTDTGAIIRDNVTNIRLMQPVAYDRLMS